MDITPDGAHITLRQEEFSYAYIRAMASVVGYEAGPKSRIMDCAGIDVSIEVPNTIENCLSPSINLQVKCTYKNCIKDGNIHFPITKRAYKRLSHKGSYKKQILVIVMTPKDLSRWISHGRKLDRISTILGASAYWISLEGWPEIDEAKKSKTISIPVSNRLTSETIKLWMAEVVASRRSYEQYLQSL
jgi:hypothetical protein